MGGRGSSSGGVGGGGGGIIIFDKPGAYGAKEADLISNRHIYPNSSAQALTVANNVYNEYGESIGQLTIADIPASSATMAYYSNSNPDGYNHIAVNKTIMAQTTAQFNSEYDRQVQSGWHPSRGNKSGLEAVTAHEYGHMLMHSAADKMGDDYHSASERVIKDAMRSQGRPANAIKQYRSRVSGYASVKNTEAIAEAFADVYCNNKKARSESIAIVNAMNKYLKP